MTSQEELESRLEKARATFRARQHDLNNAIQGIKMIEELLEIKYGVKPRQNPAFQPWICPDCNQEIPFGQYHDCKGGTLP